MIYTGGLAPAVVPGGAFHWLPRHSCDEFVLTSLSCPPSLARSEWHPYRPVSQPPGPHIDHPRRNAAEGELKALAGITTTSSRLTGQSIPPRNRTPPISIRPDLRLPCHWIWLPLGRR
jgi:hypothetical protein